MIWKRRKRSKWEKEVLSEAHTLSKLRHRNVINCWGLFSTSDLKAIVLEYMPQGSLHVHLHEFQPCQLTWEQRFNILLGVTHSMVYLHHDCEEAIIHRDLKPSNVFLDADMEAKVCHFGISKFVARDRGETTASRFCGTFGCMPPEYGTGARVSTKGDVYSYGVVLLELLTAKPVTGNESTSTGTTTNHTTSTGNSTYNSQYRNLVGLVDHGFQDSDRSAFHLLDRTLHNEVMNDDNTKEKILLTLQVGLFCTKANPQNRPSMKEVLEMLLQIKEVRQKRVTPKTLEDLLIGESFVDLTPQSADSQ